MHIRTTPQQQFLLGLFSLCLAYFLIALYMNSHIKLSVDEFWFAHNSYHYLFGLPYRDFPPYKTVLGYYVLLIPMLIPDGSWQTLIDTKHFLAFINVSCLFFCAWRLSRFFSRSAILMSLLFILCSDNMLFYATNIRVDLLGYWFGLFALLALLENRQLLAGLLLGLGFITTQKIIWFIFASNGALGVYWLVYQRQLRSLFAIINFNLMTALLIVTYILFWSWIANWHTVFNSLFVEASAMYHLDWYAAARKSFWSYILTYNPFLMLAWPLSLFSLLITFKNDTHYRLRVFLLTYTSTIFLCLIPYKQVFPYYMQVTIPALLLLYAAFFTWLEGVFAKHQTLILYSNSLVFCLLSSLFVLIYCSVIIYFALPYAYFILLLLPITISAMTLNLTRPQQSSLEYLTGMTILFIGVIYPMALISGALFHLSSAYQQANLRVVDALTQDGTDYVAGIELLYQKTQPIAGMRHLMGPALDYLARPSAKLKPAMLASLYEDPNVTMDSVITAWQAANVKLFVNNYRMSALPKPIMTYLNHEYLHYWGSIYLYAPTIAAGNKTIKLKFSGRYRIISKQADTIRLNQHTYATNDLVWLSRGTYHSFSSETYRLRLLPDNMSGLLKADYWYDASFRLTF